MTEEEDEVLTLAFNQREAATLLRAMIEYQRALLQSSIAATPEGAVQVTDELEVIQRLQADLVAMEF